MHQKKKKKAPESQKPSEMLQNVSLLNVFQSEEFL